jgi:hypothetical protein
VATPVLVGAAAGAADKVRESVVVGEDVRVLVGELVAVGVRLAAGVATVAVGVADAAGFVGVRVAGSKRDSPFLASALLIGPSARLICRAATCENSPLTTKSITPLRTVTIGINKRNTDVTLRNANPRRLIKKGGVLCARTRKSVAFWDPM